MVDSTKGVSQIPGITQANKLQPAAKKANDEGAEKIRNPNDEVELRKKRKDLSPDEAEQASRDSRKQLEDNDLNLGLGNNFDETV